MNICNLRNKKGVFIRKNNIFSLENFTDGYINNDNRFMVYYPASKRAYKNGYIARSIAAYELYHNTSVEKNYDIHHMNNNSLDDSFENLIKLTREDHNYFHSQQKTKKSNINCICKICSKPFSIKKYKLKEKGRGSYCSQSCYQKAPKKRKI